MMVTVGHALYRQSNSLRIDGVLVRVVNHSDSYGDDIADETTDFAASEPAAATIAPLFGAARM